MSRGVARLFPHPRSRSDAILDALHAALLALHDGEGLVVYIPAYLATIHGMPSVSARRDRRFRATRGARSPGRRRRACTPKVWKLHLGVHPARLERGRQRVRWASSSPGSRARQKAFFSSPTTICHVGASGCSTGPDRSARVAISSFHRFSSTVPATPTSASYACRPIGFFESCARS